MVQWPVYGLTSLIQRAELYVCTITLPVLLLFVFCDMQAANRGKTIARNGYIVQLTKFSISNCLLFYQFNPTNQFKFDTQSRGFQKILN